MKFLTALALTFFLSTFMFVVGHNIVHHEDEPSAELPSAVAHPPTTTAPPHHANVAMTFGATSFSDVADGRNEGGKLVATHGDGLATTMPEERRLQVRATTSAPDGRSVWFALLGSDLTVTKGSISSATAVVRADGLSWHGRLTSDGGTAAVEIRLQVQNSAGVVLGNVVAFQAGQTTTGSQVIDAVDRSVSVDVPIANHQRTDVLRAYVYVKVDVPGGSGGTAADLSRSATQPEGGITYGALAIAIGQPPPPTIAAPAAGATGSITAALLATHSSDQSCWLLIEGRVYDVTRFLRKHPGSQLPVLKMCGKESTEAFLTQGGRGSRHSYEAVDKLKQFYVGDYAG